jgi:L-ascorbate metabolism protein UlaG (beta-lactamase superfamily)
MIFDNDRTLWTAWVLEGSAGRAYFAGDTGYGAHFAETARRLGPMRLAVLPIGAFRPQWLLGPVHEEPVDAVRAAQDLRAGMAVPMHYGTFRLGDDGETEAVEALRVASADAGVDFEVLGFGQGRDVP